MRTGQPVVGDIVKGAYGHWGIPLRAPVVRGGKVLYVVTVVLKPQVLAQILASMRLSPQSITAVVNAQGHIVARSSGGERLWGQPINAEAAQAARPRRRRRLSWPYDRGDRDAVLLLDVARHPLVGSCGR